MINAKKGSHEVIFGNMFSSKSEEMLRRLRRGEIAGQKVMLFKSATETHFESNIRSRDGRISRRGTL